jgi:hypothetical protein
MATKPTKPTAPKEYDETISRQPHVMAEDEKSGDPGKGRLSGTSKPPAKAKKPTKH